MSGDLDYILFAILAPIAGIALIAAVASILPYRKTDTVRSLLWYLGSVVGLLTVNLFEMVSRSDGATLLWARAFHVALPATVLSWFFFGMQYSGRHQMFRSRRTALVLAVPLVTIVLVWTNRFHTLFWANTTIYETARFSTVRPDYGPWFWVYGIYIYALVFLGLLAIVRTYGTNRGRQMYVGVGATLPILFNLAYVFRLLPWLRKDYTALVYAMSGLLFYVGVHRLRLVPLKPIRHQIVVQDVPTAVIVLDAHGYVVDANPAAAVLFDTNADTLIGQNCSAPLLGPVLAGVPLYERQNFETSISGNGDLVLDVWIQPIRAKSGKHAGSIVTINNVTEWSSLVEEKTRALNKLDEEMARVGDLQIQLRSRERLAVVGQLAANMAHEVNNPLVFVTSGFNAVSSYLERGFAAYGRDFADTVGTDREALRETLQDVSGGLERISGVVETLLQFARSSRRDDPAVRAPFDSIVAESVSLVRSALRGIDLHLDVGDVPPLNCHRYEISQVLVNLLINAIHSLTEAGTESPRIVVAARVHDGAIRCSVSDNGPGVPDTARDSVFEPFFSTKPERVGTGLGLSISRDIVENRHGGSMWLESAQPATFVFDLPVD